MPAAIIVAIILTFAVFFQAKSTVRIVAGTPKSIQTVTPATTSPLVVETRTPKPSVTNVPLSPTPTTSPSQPKYYPLTTPTATPILNVQDDKEAPVFEWMTGPEDGSTVAFKNFCFPMKINDNSGQVWVRYSFDSGPGDWGKDFAPCFQNVSNGWHTFVAQAKDAAGNVATAHSRYFNVNIPVPNTISPMPTSIVNEPLDQ